ncbi:MAG: septum site-determining protein MinC [Cellvibrio sp.]
MTDVDFQLKGSAVTVVSLSIRQFDEAEFKRQLNEKIEQAPHFFANSPVVINFSEFDIPKDGFDLSTLLTLCRSMGLQPLAFSGVPDQLKDAVELSGLAILPTLTERALKIPKSEAAPVERVIERVVERVVEERVVQRTSKIVTRPVRSGQQIYAEGADLIVMAQVSEGAEVLADGNIHVYGTLRGRALAGVKGDETARIFCQSLDAELVSIAGNFILQDALPTELQKKPAQISLEGTKVLVSALGEH